MNFKIEKSKSSRSRPYQRPSEAFRSSEPLLSAASVCRRRHSACSVLPRTTNYLYVFITLCMHDLNRQRLLYCHFLIQLYLSRTPQAPDKFNPKVNLQTCGIIQMLYETKQIETMTFGKSVIALFSKIEPKTSK